MRIVPNLMTFLGLVGCSDATIKTFNAAPTASINSHVDGDEINEEALTNLFGKVADSNHGADSLVATWYVDGEIVCEAATPDPEGGTICEAALPTGETRVLLEVSDPDGASGNDAVRITVVPSTPPEISILDPYAEGPYRADEPIRFRGRILDAEDGFDRLTAWWNSNVDGDLDLGTTLSEDGLVDDYTSLSSGTHVITLGAEDSSGKQTEEEVIIEVSEANTAPVISEVVITPDTGVTTSTTLTCEASWTDDDGEDLTPTYAWTDGDDSALGTGASLTLEPTTVSVGTTVTCTATVTDGRGETSTGQDSVTVENTPPTIDRVEITPDTGVTTSTTLTCDVTATDPDGDTPTYEYEWTLTDGTSLGTDETLTLDPLFAAPGDTITCTAIATDAAGATDEGTDSVTVENTGPRITSVAITPDTDVRQDTMLTCTATAEDDDGEVPTILLVWDVDSVAAGTGGTLDLSTLLPEAGAIVTCTATATDGHGGSDEGTDSVTVDNTPPEILTVSLSPTEAYTNDTITALVTTSDADGDPVTVAYDWFVNGTSSGETGASLSGSTHFDKHDTVHVVVTPNDGFTDGDPVPSDSITILNSPPSSPGVRFEAEACYLEFDGDADFVDVGSIGALEDFTAEAWILMDPATTIAGNGRIIDYDGGSSGAPNDLFHMGVMPDGTIRTAVRKGGSGDDRVIDSTTTVNDGDWHHVSAVRDGDDFHVFVDGILEASATGAADTISHGNPLAIGATLWDGADDPRDEFTGLIRSVRMSSSARYTTDFMPSDSWLVDPETIGQWMLDEGSGSIATDEAGAHDGSIEGATWTGLCTGLVCVIDPESTDADGDPVSYTVEMDLDGSAFTDTDTTTHPGDTIPTDALGTDETWTCTVTPNDGEEDGAPGTDSYTIYIDPCIEIVHDGSTYAFCDVARTRDDAQADCEDRGMDLVSLSSASEDAWVNDTAHAIGMSDTGTASVTHPLWIGLTASGGTLAWDSGEVVAYTHIVDRDDGDSAWFRMIIDCMGHGDCESRGEGGWFDMTISSTQEFGYVCEDDPEEVVEDPCLVARYTFDEGGGSVAVDSSGNGLHGTIVGADWTVGITGDALDFSDGSSWVDLGTDPLFDLTTEISIEAWVWIDGSTDDHQIVLGKWYAGGATHQTYIMELQPNGRNLQMPLWGISPDGAPGAPYHTDPVPWGEWVHVASTWDGTTERLYVNGVEHTAFAATGTIPVTPATVFIGAHDAAGDRNGFNGLIDEVSLYCRALGADEIEEHALEHAVPALDLDASDGVVIVEHHEDFNVGLGDFTVEFLFNQRSSPLDSTDGFLGIRRSGENYLYLRATRHGDGWRPYIQLTKPAGSGWNKVTFEADTSTPYDAWAHLVFQRRSGEIEIFVDGMEQSHHTVGGGCCSSGDSDPASYPIDNTGPWVIGANSDTVPAIGVGSFPGILGGFRYTAAAVYTGDFITEFPLPSGADTVVNLLLTEAGGTDLDNDAGALPEAWVDTESAWTEYTAPW